MLIQRQISLAILTMTLGLAAHAQIAELDTMAPQRGIVPFGTYAIDKIEAINTTTGSLNLTIPIASLPPGPAGFSTTLNLIYNSELFDLSSNNSGALSMSTATGGGWNYGYDYALVEEDMVIPPGGPGGCAGGPYYYKLSLVTPDGSNHVLLNDDDPTHLNTAFAGYYKESYLGDTGCPGTGSGRNTTYYTADGTYLRLAMHSDQTWTLDFPDGRQVIGANQHATELHDANGNIIHINNVSLLGSGPTTTITDDSTSSRTITISHFIGGPFYDEVTYPASDGSLLTTVINWRVITVAGTFPDGVTTPDPAYGGSNPIGISTLVLPTVNSYTPTYTFYYHAYPDETGLLLNPDETGLLLNAGWGELKSINLPSGATVAYSYALDGAKDRGLSQQGLTANPVVGKFIIYTNTWGSTSAVDTWTYAYPSCSTPSTITYCNTVMTDPQGGTTEYDYISPASAVVSGGAQIGSLNRGLVYRTTYPDGSRDETRWAHNTVTNPGNYTSGNPYADIKAHSIPGGTTQVAVQTITDNQNGNITGSASYDWINYTNVNFVGSDPMISSVSGLSSALSTTTTSYIAGSSAYSDSGTARHWNLANSSYTTGAGYGKGVNYTYDSAGNPIAEAHWDSTKGGSASSFYATQAAVTLRSFDTNGNLLSVTDPNNNTTSYTYDSYGRYVTDIYQAGLRHFTLEHGPTGLLTQVLDGDNCVASDCAQTNYGYDITGRVTTITDGTGSVLRETQYTYDDSTRTITTQTDKDTPGDGLIVKTDIFDQLGRPYQTTQSDPGGTITQEHDYQYYGANRYELASNPYRSKTGDTTMGWTETIFDQLNRPVCVKTFSGATPPTASYSGGCVATGTTGASGFSYSSYSTTATDQNGISHTTSVDGMGRLSSVVENGISATTSYGYDVQGNLTSVSQSGQSRSFGYTSLGRLYTATNPENGTTTYSYDNNGNMTGKTDNRSVTTTITYNALNQPLSKSYSDSTPTVNYTYGADLNIAGTPNLPNFPVGRLTQVSTSYSGGSTYTNTYRYDALGRVQASMQSIGTSGNPFVDNYPFAYTYSPAGLLSETYPSGTVINNQYDIAGRVSQVSGTPVGGSATTYAGSVTYAPHGVVSSFTMNSSTTSGTPVPEAITFNTRLQPTGIQAGTGTPLLNLAYDYGTTTNNGNVLSQTITRSGGSPPWTQTYGYDAINRLNSFGETGPGTSMAESYTYDAYGNWALTSNSGLWTGAVTAETPQATAWYDTSTNHITHTASPAWGYDGAGNITVVGGIGCSPASICFQYDAENRLTQSNVGGITESYTYDGEGRRVSKSGTAGTATYIYDASGELAAEYPAGTISPGTAYLTVDALGSTRLVTDGGGTVKECEDYLPFGQQILGGADARSATCFSAADLVPEKKFTGKERDAESGWDYFGARYLSSMQGRWTSPDWSDKPAPIPYADLSNPQTLNLYSYVRNNPLSSVDPNGHYIVSSAKDQQFYEQTLTDLYRRPEGRELVNSLASSDRLVEIDRHTLDTASTGIAGLTTLLSKAGEAGVLGADVTVGTDEDLTAGAKLAPGKVSSDLTTAHELEHANDAITAGRNSVDAGYVAAAAGDAPSSPGKKNTIGGTAQARAQAIMSQKTDMSEKDARSAIQRILKSGKKQWQDIPKVCQHPDACH